MIDISVKDLVKSFDEDGNLLDGISFDVQSGERVGLLGKNGAGKTTLFKILTGEIDYNSGTIAFAQGKKVGLISQIPVYPPEYLVSDVLRAAFSGLDRICCSTSRPTIWTCTRWSGWRNIFRALRERF